MRPAVWIAIFSFGIVAACRCSSDQLRAQCAFAIQNGLDFVASSQTPTGGFITDCWHVDAPEHKTQVDAVFTASQVLYSLSFCKDSARARGTEERAAKYLTDQQKSPGVWSYYGNGTEIKISPDVDDTSVAWAALQRLQISIPPTALDAVRASRDQAGLIATRAHSIERSGWNRDLKTLQSRPRDRGVIDVGRNLNVGPVAVITPDSRRFLLSGEIFRGALFGSARARRELGRASCR